MMENNPDLSSLYYECHITIDPVFEEEREKLQGLVSSQGFQLAKLLMQKRMEDTPERSKYDTFMTSHDKSFAAMLSRMKNAVFLLRENGYIVRRYKIENVILDSRIKEILI